jgi:hypothetical protein
MRLVLIQPAPVQQALPQLPSPGLRFRYIGQRLCQDQFVAHPQPECAACWRLYQLAAHRN